MKYAGRTHTGNVREINEDSFYYSERFDFAVVADGMGGHNAGEVASKLAVDKVKERLSALDAITPLDMREAVEEANAAVFSHAEKSRGTDGMGTTLVIAALDGETVCVSNVGDSRAYFFDSKCKRLNKITRDHSLVQELLSSNLLTPEEAKKYPYKNVITRAIGTAETVKADLFDVEWSEGDILLLCTDGLSGYVAESEMENTVCGCESIDEICSALVSSALSAGGGDNITLVAVQNTSKGGDC